MPTSTLIQTLLLAFTIAVAGCSFNYEISGEIFIENNGIPQKITNAEVMLIEEKVFADHIKKKFSESSSAISEIDKLIEEKLKLINFLDHLTKKVEESSSKQIAALQFEEQVRASNNYKLALMSMVPGPSAVSGSIEARLKNEILSAQMSTLTKQRDVLYSLFASHVSRKLVELKNNAQKTLPICSADEYISIEAGIERLLSGKLSTNESLAMIDSYSKKLNFQEVPGASKSKELSNQVSEKIRSEIVALKLVASGIRSGKNGAFYLPSSELILPDYKVTTDLSGSFKLKAPNNGQKFVLVAHKDNNYWFLRVHPKSDKKYILSNLNLAGENCDACVFGIKKPSDY